VRVEPVRSSEELRARVPLGHSIASHMVLDWCSGCPDRDVFQEANAWRLWAINNIPEVGEAVSRNFGEDPDAGESNRIGDVEVAHGQATVLLVLHGRWPGTTQMSPDAADAVAAKLRKQAAHARA
jgi:hypothetical protein